MRQLHTWAFLVYNGMILSIGTASYVAHNIAGTIESYAYIPCRQRSTPGTATMRKYGIAQSSTTPSAPVSFRISL